MSFKKRATTNHEDKQTTYLRKPKICEISGRTSLVSTFPASSGCLEDIPASSGLVFRVTGSRALLLGCLVSFCHQYFAEF